MNAALRRTARAGARGRTRHGALRALTAAVLSIATAAATGCSAGQESRFLTQEEAETVAMARFRSFEEGTREVTVVTTGPDGSVTGLHGYFDYVGGAGIAQLWHGDEEPEEQTTDLVWWTHAIAGELVSDDPAPDTHEEVPQPDPDDPWEFFALDPAASPLMTMLFTVANLGFDRPDNPQLIEQTDALRLGTGALPPLAADDEGTWYQLPSADEVRAAGADPAESALLVRMLLDPGGTIWAAERAFPSPAGDSPTTAPSTISYGDTVTEDVPAPPAEPPAEE